MDMNSKMDGSAPVSQALGGVWEIQKKGRIDDQRKENRKKDKDRKEVETEFEDGLVPKEEEMTTETGAELQKEASDSKDESPATTRKIDIII
jgi:hypothetical protein